MILLVLDEFPTTDLIGKHKRIDARRFPNFARLAGDATWYRNATTVYDTTFSAVPAILEGRIHKYRLGRRRPPRRNILSLLAQHGYRVHASAEARNVCQPRYCHGQHPTRYYLVRSRLARLARFIGSIKRTRRPTIWFKHILLPHLPWIYLPSGKQYIRGYRPPIRGINGVAGVFDPTLEHLAYQRHLLQVAALDRLLGMMLDQLQRIRLYDRALLIVVADHGISFRVGERDKRVVTRQNIQGIAPVPFFVKRPHQRHGRISGVYARNSDVAPTIARVVRVHIPWRTSGHSVWSGAVRGRHTIHVGSRLPGVNAIRISPAHFQARWGRLIRNTHGLFGIGSLARLYAIGPARRLIGRPADTIRMARPGRYHASILRRSDIRHVKRHSRVVPALVSGYIRGGRGRHRRTLAIAVNGRIAATTRSFFLRGSSREGYSVIVPEENFHLGRNEVEVLAVGHHGKRLRFRLLGRV